MRFNNFSAAHFLQVLFVAGFISLATIVSAQDGDANLEQDGVSLEGFGELLELSLKNELDAIEARKDAAHVNTWQSFSQQFHLRGRAGHPQQIRSIADAILGKHEERNRERTVTRLDSIIQEYATPESNTNGLARLIQKGELDRVFTVLESQSKIEPEIDMLHGVKRTDADRQALLADPFWLACKLAAAYHREGNAEASVSAMNLGRKILEGDKYTGVAFDANNDWLPEPDPSRGLTLGSFQQYRTTFYWTLVHLDRAELAIKWFEADVAKRKPTAEVSTWNYFGQASDNEFLGVVAREHSPARAAELAKAVLGNSISAQAFEKLIGSSLKFGDTKVATQFVRDAMHELANDGGIEYHHGLILEHLIEHTQSELATEFAKRLVSRIEQYESALKAGEDPAVKTGYWSHSTYAHLAKQVVKIDKELALRLVELHQNNDTRKEFDDWVLIEAVKAQSGTISESKHQELTTCCFADDLIEAYIESGRLELARKTVKDAAIVVRRSTYSGSSIGGGAKGLTVLDFNTYERILLAMRAVRFEDDDLVRNLLDEMTSNYNRREGYRAVTKRIAELRGEEKAKAWIEATNHPISKSGAILGLGETLFPIPENEDSIPNPFVRGGC